MNNREETHNWKIEIIKWNSSNWSFLKNWSRWNLYATTPKNAYLCFYKLFYDIIHPVYTHSRLPIDGGSFSKMFYTG